MTQTFTPCVCVNESLRKRGRKETSNTKTQDCDVCVLSHTAKSRLWTCCCCFVVSQNNVSCCKKRNNLTLDLTSHNRGLFAGVRA